MLFKCVINNYLEELSEIVSKSKFEDVKVSFVKKTNNAFIFAFVNDRAQDLFDYYGSDKVKIFANHHNKVCVIEVKNMTDFNQIIFDLNIKKHEIEDFKLSETETGNIFISTTRLEEYELIKVKQDKFMAKFRDLMSLNEKEDEEVINLIIKTIGINFVYMATINDYLKTVGLKPETFIEGLENYDLSKNFNLFVTKELYSKLELLGLPNIFVFK